MPTPPPPRSQPPRRTSAPRSVCNAERTAATARRHAGKALCAVLLALVVAGCTQAPLDTAPVQNRPPVAAFSVSPLQGPAPLTVTFDGSASTDPDGTITAYAWQFGDGATGAGVTAEHTYATPGPFTARLTVTDDRGASASATIDILVEAEGTTPDTGVETIDLSFQVTEATVRRPQELIAASIDTALEATQRNGGVATLTGTLRESAPQVYDYTSEPADRLRLVLLDGRTWEISFDGPPAGDTSGDGWRFVRNPHRIDLRVTSNAAAGSIDLTVTSAPGEASDTQLGRLIGSFDDAAGHRWSVDTSHELFTRSEVGVGYNELETQASTRGTLSAASRGITIDLQRYRRYQLVNTVESVDERMDHTITVGDTTYGLQGRVFVGFRDAKPVDRDQWVIAGGLTENGVAVAGFTASEDPSGLTVWLERGAERFTLFFFSYF